MENSDEQRKSVFKTWLETLQQESWQLELLISGLALFSVFGAKTFIDDLEGFFDVQFFDLAARLGVEILLFLIKGSWYIFLINLTIHIVLRGLWIGAIGLRYVSQDIDYDELNFSSYFRKLYTRRYESFDDYIEDLERICSVIFAYTFLLFFILISACLTVVWPIIILSLTGKFWGMLLVFLYLIFGAIVFVDFIFLNPLKKIEGKWISRIYGFLFRLFSTITLSFIFRPLLLNFLDNRFTKRLFLFSIPYGVIIILILPQITGESQAYFPKFNDSSLEYLSYYSQTINPYFYDNLRGEIKDEVKYISLKEDVVDGNILDFFVIYLGSDGRYLETNKGAAKINKIGVYSGYGKRTVQDSIYKGISAGISSELSEFLAEKEKNTESYSEQEWDERFQKLDAKHDSTKSAYYRNKIITVNEIPTDINTYFIDDLDVTEKIKCLMSEHENLGEKGWRCILKLDALESGLHNFIVLRGVYDMKNNIINQVKLEIPFILDI